MLSLHATCNEAKERPLLFRTILRRAIIVKKLLYHAKILIIPVLTPYTIKLRITTPIETGK